MATYTATAAQTNSSGFFLAPPKYNEKGVQARTAKFSYANAASAVSAGDVILMFPIAKGAVVLDVQLDVVKVAAQVTYTINVGDSNSATRYISSATNGAAAVTRLTQAAGAGYSYSTDDTLRVQLAAWGSASGSAVVRLTAFFTFDQAQDGNS